MIEKTTTYSRSANQNPGTAQPDKAPFSDGSGSVLWPIDWSGKPKPFTELTHAERRRMMAAKRVCIPTSERLSPRSARHG